MTWSDWQQASVTGLVIPAPSRMTVIAHRGALGTVGSRSGVGTFSATDAQYWRAAVEWERIGPRQYGMVMAALLGRTIALPAYATLQGNPSGSPQLDGSQEGETVATTGWEPEREGLLLPGDYVQIGDRLHQVQEAVDSGSDGHAELHVWPPVEASADASVVYDSPEALFRVSGNPKTTERPGRRFDVSAELVEDR